MADETADLQDFFDYVQASPSPRHAVAESVRRLSDAGFRAGDAGAGIDKGFSVRGGALLAWAGPVDAPARVIVAHTDSPNLRIKPKPDTSAAGYRQLGVEIYGGVLLNSWLDRDLGLAGHVVVRTDDGIETRLVNFDRPVLRIPQLAIHLDREISSKGLHLNRQQHLRPIWGLENEDEEAGLVALLAEHLDLDPTNVLAFQLMTHALAPPAAWGWHDEFAASPRIDNQLSCWAATRALAESDDDTLAVVALFDHEEVGSTSATGADSALLADALADLVGDGARGSDASLCISADCAHATHPNYADRHDPEHTIALNLSLIHI